ncbi:hypothetical protein [Pseudomonas chlororaphis]|uniref:hypothetical protein n=1 Tax=Pseudomonas chlororaphis TaxID=587753 RepID=UPI000F58AAF2|nr:hypothetical protein [Pseudomonas chlororaphis]AZC55406.1 hypothetical protein C4K34_1222 [Pseudomonas chlororaphis subsp. piscium]
MSSFEVDGPSTPLAVPMEDGYWTHWHLTAQLQVENEAMRKDAAQRQPTAKYFQASGHVDPFPESTKDQRYRLVEGTSRPRAHTWEVLDPYDDVPMQCKGCGALGSRDHADRGPCPQPYQTRKELLSALAVLRPYAERYLWLRERDLETLHRDGVFAGQTPQNMVLNGKDLDDAIDAAMGKQVAP